MTGRRCDVAIIGAGTAGLAAEQAARGAGASTLLVDDRFAGTTCATVGCMPSKLLIAAAEAARAVRGAPAFGVVPGGIAIDGAAVMQRVRRERDRFAAAAKATIRDLPRGVAIQARARFASPLTLALDDGSTVSAKAVVIATGSRPSVPAAFERLGELVLTNETLFELHELPRSVAVVGAGPLGLELAQALARLGVEVVVFDQGRSLGGLRDRAVADELKAILEAELPVRLGVELEVRRAGGAASVSWTGEEPGRRTFERVLVAAGRPPQLAGLDLERAELRLDERGAPVFDRRTMQCSGAPVFLAGDACADRPVLHEAAAEGRIAGRNAALHPDVEAGHRTVPFSLMFTDPPVAVVGDAADGDSAVVGQASYADQGRARVMDRNAGLCRLYADPCDGRLTGAAMAAPGADHTAHLIAWAIERRQTARDLLDLPIYHPTLEEGLKPALRDICRQVRQGSGGGDLRR